MSLFPTNAQRNQFLWAPFDLEAHFDYVSGRGWDAYYAEGEKQYGESEAMMLAHGSKEGGCYFFHKYPDGGVLGDFREGNPTAFGMHQPHLFGNQTKDDVLLPKVNVPEAFKRIAANRKAIRIWAAKVNLPVEPNSEYEDHLVLDAYNRGLTGEEKSLALDPSHPDAPTAGGSYATDILMRKAFYQQLLDARNVKPSDPED